MKITLAAASLIALLTAAPAIAGELPAANDQFAQAEHTNGAPHADQWIYDQHGDKMGSVRSVNPAAGTAQILIGFYTYPGSRVATVPLSSLTMSGSRLVLLDNSARG